MVGPKRTGHTEEEREELAAVRPTIGELLQVGRNLRTAFAIEGLADLMTW